MDTITIEDIHEMTPEEREALTRAVYRKLGKQMLTKIAIGAGVIITAHFVANKLDARWNGTTETPEED